MGKHREYLTLSQIAQTSGISSARLSAAAQSQQIFPDTRLGRNRFYGPRKIAEMLRIARQPHRPGRPRGKAVVLLRDSDAEENGTLRAEIQPATSRPNRRGNRQET